PNDSGPGSKGSKSASQAAMKMVAIQITRRESTRLRKPCATYITGSNRLMAAENIARMSSPWPPDGGPSWRSMGCDPILEIRVFISPLITQMGEARHGQQHVVVHHPGEFVA